ncbi:MAG: class I SAM-dependent methyltransferase [Chitinophaga sp.]|uniref:class I SAM-dependent methyltransferase n=1 Tax=Chitinophaga sp. TaxID=1869181 RepID=UPI001B2DA9EF|nr:class I SAM-dependent methyltransferase [Chitinophaga sp.]MBO9730291.1 class I SAM-dependent methyltransferase [Chitinophaga sp.]
MHVADAIALIKNNVIPATGNWADLGCGSGLFTYALAHYLDTGSIIYALDKDKPSLSPLPNPHQVVIQPMQVDFVKDDLPVSALTGILMANSIHYVADKPAFIERIKPHLQEKSFFLMVEYETTRANPWVPYPVPFNALKTLFHQAGFTMAVKLGERPSVYQSGTMYAALFAKNAHSR